MSQLWAFTDSVWTPAELRAGVYGVTRQGRVVSVGDTPDAASAGPTEAATLPAAWLIRSTASGGETWVLIAVPAADVHVNGEPLVLGMAVLRDKDCVRVGFDPADDGRCYFSTERLAQREVFGETAKTMCPRCKQAIEPGQPVVRCPHCGVWHHELPERNCWTYAPICAACHSQPTPLDASFRWTPEGL